MKSIKELRNEGKISKRTYNVIRQRTLSEINYRFGYKRLTLSDLLNNREVKSNEVTDLTVKEIFDLFGENEMLRWRGLGSKGLSELKSLI